MRMVLALLLALLEQSNALTRKTGDWKAVDADVESLIKLAAARMPVP